MKILDSHVKKYYRYMYLKTCNPDFHITLILFLFFLTSMGFYLGYTYATATYDLFNIQNECLRVIREIKF